MIFFSGEVKNIRTDTDTAEVVLPACLFSELMNHGYKNAFYTASIFVERTSNVI